MDQETQVINQPCSDLWHRQLQLFAQPAKDFPLVQVRPDPMGDGKICTKSCFSANGNAADVSATVGTGASCFQIRIACFQIDADGPLTPKGSGQCVHV